MPDAALKSPAGELVERNPGVSCVWSTRTSHTYRPSSGVAGILFDIGEPTSTDWYCEGRTATRAEIEESIRTGLPFIKEKLAADDDEGWTTLARRLGALKFMLDAAYPPPQPAVLDGVAAAPGHS